MHGYKLEYCPLCKASLGNSDITKAYCVDQTYLYLECPRCHSFVLENFNEHHAIPKVHYPEDYYTQKKIKSPLSYLQKCWAEHSYGLPTLLGRFCSWFMGTPHTTVRHLAHLGVGKSSVILDYGCGNGQLVKMLRHLGFRNVNGYDPMTYFESENWGKVDYHADVVIFCHSIEHLENPSFLLKLIAKCMKPGGLLIIQCPMVPNLALSYYSHNWIGWDAPRHITIPSLQALDDILIEDCKLSRMSHIHNESTLWNYQASHDNMTRNFHSPLITKLIHFIGRFSPDPINREIRRRFEEQKNSPYSDCRAMIYVKPNACGKSILTEKEPGSVSSC